MKLKLLLLSVFQLAVTVKQNTPSDPAPSSYLNLKAAIKIFINENLNHIYKGMSY
jgi:hypothetical protein